MKTVHQKLQLQHRRHTGKLLHHRHTSYRGLAVVLGMAGLLIVGLNVLAKVTADELYVYARIPAPIPTMAAAILNPADGSTTRIPDISVSGTCPVITPSVIITILDNGRVAGSQACDTNNSFVVPITLDQGNNELIARSTTVTGDNGPDSSAVRVTYIPPAPPPVKTGTKPVAPTPPTSPLRITTDQSYVVYGPAQDAILHGTISGGTAPYHVHVDWGDRTTTDYTTHDTVQTFRHHYRHTGTYDITVTITDSAGNVLVQHFAAVTPYVPPAAAAGGTTPDSPLKRLLNALGQWLGGTKLVGVYGGYILVLALFGIFWLRRHPFAYAKVPVRHTPAGSPGQRSKAAARKRRRKDTTAS